MKAPGIPDLLPDSTTTGACTNTGDHGIPDSQSSTGMDAGNIDIELQDYEAPATNIKTGEDGKASLAYTTSTDRKTERAQRRQRRKEKSAE